MFYGCAVGDHQMWQNVRAKVLYHEHVFKFVPTILDAPGAQKPVDLPCQPQASRKMTSARATVILGSLAI